MKLVSLYCNNFKKLQFDNILKFSDGITVVSGLNEAGKSTILDAILYALYGRVIRPSGRMKDADIIRYGAGKATVILEFEIAGHTYKVKREIHRNRTNTASLDEILEEKRLRQLATRVREVTSVVETLLGGITFNELVSSNIVAQKDLDRLVKEGSDRRKVINAFLNLESFNTVLDSLNEERKDLEGTGPSRPGTTNLERDKLNDLRSELEEFNKRKNEVMKLEGEIKKISQDVERLDLKHKELKSLHDALSKYDEAITLKERLATELDGKTQVLKTHQDEINGLTERISGLKNKLEDFANLPSDSAISGISAKLEELREVGRKQRNAEDRAKTVAENIEGLKKELQGFDRKEIDKARRTQVYLKPYAVGTTTAFLMMLILFLLSAPVLPWITGGVGAILLLKLVLGLMQINKLARLEGLLGKAEVLDEKNKELFKIKEESTKDFTKSSSTRKALAEALADLERYKYLLKEAEGPEIGAELFFSQYTEEKVKKEKIESNIASLTDSLGETSRRVDRSRMQSEIDELERRIEMIELPKLPKGIRFSKELLMRVSRDKEDIRGSIESNKSKIDGWNERIKENNQHIEEHWDINDNVKSQEKVVQDLENNLKVVKASIGAISKTAELLRNRVKPGVESFMGQILPSITSSRYKAVILDEAFGVQVWDPEAGEFRPKEVFSGGTEDQFLLAMRLAFALALMPEIKGTKPDFLFLDEPLGSSDEVRRAGIIEYLNVRLSKLFSQIFIISHVGGLEELVPNVIRLDEGRVVK